MITKQTCIIKSCYIELVMVKHPYLMKKQPSLHQSVKYSSPTIHPKTNGS